MNNLKENPRFSLSITGGAAFQAVFWLFPVFMIYQALAQFQIISPVLGSYFSVAAVVTLPLSVWVVVRRFGFFKCLNLFCVKLLFLLIAMMLLLSMNGYFSGVNPEINDYHFRSAIRFCSLFFVMFSFGLLKEKSKYLLYLFLVGYSVFVCIFSTAGTFVLPALVLEGYVFELDYQQLALVYLVILIMMLPERNTNQRLVLYLVTLPAMLFIGARSEFFAFFIIIFVVELSRHGARFIVVCYFLLVSLIVVGAFFINNIDLSGYRMFSIFSSEGDLSLNSRKSLQMHALRTIAEHPLTGDYSSHEPGAYAHSALAAWVDYGILGFILLLVLVLGPFFSLMLKYRRYYGSPFWIQAFSSVSVTVFLLIFAKSYTYSMVPVAIALYCVFRLNLKKYY